ncbi:MAG: hypothetical protein J6R29_02045 [Clostridia bacterium]|nr:hypothetical protein [Clostridia bacterium]
MKKFMLTLSVLIVAFIISLISPTFVSAETEEAVLNDTYNYLVLNPLETVLDVQEYSSKVENGIILAEAINADEEKRASIEGFDKKYTLILKKYKLFVRDYKLTSIYNPEDYPNTENGLIKINNEKLSAKLNIDNATSKQQVDEAFSAFYELINSNDLAKNVNIAKTNEQSQIYAQAVTADDSLYFSTDDYLIVSKYNDSAIIKNTNVALLDSEELLMENGGVAYYFNIQLNKNGVVVDSIEKPIIVKIKLEDVGLTLSSDVVAQIATYNGNRKVTLQNATVVDNYLTFEISNVGKYALCLEGYAIEHRSAVVTFFAKYGIYVLLGLLVLFLIIAPIQYSRKLKKKKVKTEKKEFKRFKKGLKKDKKSKKGKKNKK